MNYPIITNFNFTSTLKFEGPKPEGYDRYYGCWYENNSVIFEANYICCPCIYYVKKDELFAYSFDPDSVVLFAKENGIELSDNYTNIQHINENIRIHIKPSIKKRYKYNLNYIEGWKKVILNRDGSFTVIKNDFIPFTKDIKDNFEDFKKFLNKYKNYVDYLIDRKLFMPTLTGGLDTRYFTGLYRDRVNELPGYFCTSVKQDGKNNYAQGQLEIKLAEQVAKKINLKTERFEDLGNYNTITGMFNENANEYEFPNDIEYIYKIVQHGYDNTHQYVNKLTPFMDDDYLQFKQDGELVRCLLCLYLSPDLVFIPFISGTFLYNLFPEGCSLYKILKPKLTEAAQFLENINSI